MSHIFISYSKKNREYAQLLASDLRRRGFDIWIDDQLEPSEDWWRNIRQAIRACAAFTIVMTPESEASHWVQLELLHALEFKKPIFPLFRGGDPNPLNSDIWSRIANIQFTNVQHGNLPADLWYEKMIARGVPSKFSNGLNLTPPQPPAVNSTSSKFAELTRRTLDVLPPPFEWCGIPAGKVTVEYGKWKDNNYSVESKKDFHVERFAIAKYPITNAQYQEFVEKGYADTSWWEYSKEARIWRKEHPEPKDSFYKELLVPRSYLCWYDAVAFCRWLNRQVMGAKHDALSSQITLPTEQQWQRAAQGDMRFLYPWGNDFDAARCNASESGIKKPTPVTQYLNGASPYDVLDMSGNIWDWCLTTWNNDSVDLSGSEQRVLRGGAFNCDQIVVACAHRFEYPPHAGDYYCGMRVVCMPL
jgi:formylglycine-generating enzyme required for sulfatase activity